MLAALFGKGQKELKVLYILITLTLAAILLYPLGCVLFQSVLTKEGGIGLTNYTSLLSQSSFWTALANSFTVSGISAAIATLMAFFCAYGLHFTRIRPGVKKVIQIIVLLPLFFAIHHIRFCCHLLIRPFRANQSIDRPSPFFHLWLLGTTDCRCYLYAAAGFSDSL